MVILYIIPALLIAITFHEFAHAFVAYRLGDNTAKKAGRVTLNPLAHLDPVGTLMLVLVHFGWGKPVPVSPQNFRHPVLYNILVAVSGPLSNLLIALISLALLKHGVFGTNEIAVTFLHVLYDLNIILMIFNLLPIPPLDGGHFLEAVIPKHKQALLDDIYRYGPVVLLTILLAEHFLGVRLISAVLLWAHQLITAALYMIV